MIVIDAIYIACMVVLISLHISALVDALKDGMYAGFLKDLFLVLLSLACTCGIVTLFYLKLVSLV